MSKKSLFFGSTVLLIAMLFTLAGCNNPTGPEGPKGDTGLQGNQGQEIKGDQGFDGDFGGYRLTAVVKPVDLEVAFQEADVAVLITTVRSVYGLVPPGKTLVVLGDAPVAVGQRLELGDGAVLDIRKGATLYASGIDVVGGSTNSGLLVSSSGAVPAVTGEGAIFLPAVQSGAHDGFLHWESDVVDAASEHPGSFTDGSTKLDGSYNIVPFNSASIAILFNRPDDQYSELKIPDVVNLTANAIPSGKTLILLGTGNTIGTPFTLKRDATLIVDEDARLTIDAAFSGESGSAFINRGTGKDNVGVDLGVDLGATGLIADTPDLDVTNDGIIRTDNGTEARIRTLLALGGTGTVKVSVDVGLTVSALLLNQNLEVDSPQAGPVATFTLSDIEQPIDENSAAGKIITIAEADTLALGADSLLIGYLTGTAPNQTPVRTKVVLNDGVIDTATEVSSTLTEIFTSIDSKGAVTASGAVELDGSLVIPKDVTLTLTDATTTFAAATVNSTPWNLTIAGEFKIGGADLVPPDDITITETAVIDLETGSLTIGNAGSAKILKISSSAEFEDDVLSTGTLVQGAGGKVTIDDEEDYSIAAGGVQGGLFKTALADIKKTIGEILVDTLEVEEHFVGGGLVIGTVNLVPTLNPAVPGPAGNADPVPIVSRVYAGGEKYVIVPDLIGITVPGTGLTCLGSSPVFGGTLPLPFTLSVDGNPGLGNHRLGLQDSTALPVAPGDRDEVFGILEFTDYTVEKSGLVSPPVTTKFHIGVRSIRTL
jgi:hypothetical protein